MLPLGIMLVLIAMVWFWLDSLKVREKVIAQVRQRCQQVGVQLLDQTVSMNRLRLGRNARGNMVFRRFFSFEVSWDGAQREQGMAVMLGSVLQHFDFPSIDGRVIDVVTDDIHDA